VCTESGAHPWEREMRALTPDVFVLPRFLRSSDQARFVAYLAFSRQLDVVLLSGSTAGYRMLPLLRALTPTAAYVDLVHEDRAMARFSVARRAFLHRSVAVSAHVRQHLIEQGGKRTRIGVVHPCIEPRAFTRVRALRQEVRARLGLSAAQPLVAVLLGSYEAHRRPALALAALRRAAAQLGAPVRALLLGGSDAGGEPGGARGEHAGDAGGEHAGVGGLELTNVDAPAAAAAASRPLSKGRVRAQVVEALRALNGSAQVVAQATLANHRSLVRHLSACDILLYASSAHGVSTELQQAMSLSLYPVATWAPGRDELVRVADGVGSLVRPEVRVRVTHSRSGTAVTAAAEEEAEADEEEGGEEEEAELARRLGDALAEAASQLQRTRAHGQQARELILRRWSPHAMAEQLLEELELAVEQVLLDPPLSQAERLAARELAAVGFPGGV
jgi:glycosyltransferase involved in cell wall biosynthesis